MTDSWAVFMYYIGIDDSDKLTIALSTSTDLYLFAGAQRYSHYKHAPSIFLVKP